MKQRVTIEDIAAEVGVSRQTVTRAMNGLPRISPETKQRILDAARRLGYQPSRFAKNLASSKKTTAVGFVVESFRNPYYGEFTAELHALLAKKGWQLTVSSQEVAAPIEAPRRLSEEVDILVGYLAGDPDELVSATHGVPMVVIGEVDPRPHLHSVSLDFESGLAELIDGLRARGSRRFGLLEMHLSDVDYFKSDRRLAYEQVVGAESRDAVIVCDADFRSIDSAVDGFRRLMAEFPQTDTVIASTDLMAMGALSAASQDGYSVPGDVRVVGNDGLSLGGLTLPPLSTLDVIGSGLAPTIVDLIERILDGTADDSEHLKVTPHPLWRVSA